MYLRFHPQILQFNNNLFSPTAIIEIADPSSISSTGKFTVPLLPLEPPPEVPQPPEPSSDDKSQKPKIIEDEVFPKGTINHVLSKLNPPLSDKLNSPRREGFGIKSTVPCRRSLNPSSYFENLDSKIASAFSKTWSAIPEIAALLVSPSKKMDRDRCFDENAMDNSELINPNSELTKPPNHGLMNIPDFPKPRTDTFRDIPELNNPPKDRLMDISELTKPLEKHKSHSISNTDLLNGHAKSSAVLNGLFSDPHDISSIRRNGRGFKKSRDSSKCSERRSISINNGQRIKDKTCEKVDVVESVPLTKENLTKLDVSTSGTNVLSHVMSMMDPPGKSNAISRPQRIFEPREDYYATMTFGRKRTADKGLKSPEKKRVKKRGRWSLNDDEASSCTSNDSRLSAAITRKSLSNYPLSFNKTPVDINAWLTKDVAASTDFKDETSHSPHSARTHVNSPIDRDDEDRLLIDETVAKAPSLSKIDEEEEEKDERIESDNNSSSGASSKTVANSGKESASSGIGSQEKETEKEKEAFVAEDENTQEAREAAPAIKPQVTTNANEKDEEDTLILDYEEDDFLNEPE